MHCPNCNAKRASCVDSRPSEDGKMRRRRYMCSRGHRFSTYETYVTSEVWDNRGNLAALQQALAPVLSILNNLPELQRLLPRSTMKKHHISDFRDVV